MGHGESSCLGGPRPSRAQRYPQNCRRSATASRIREAPSLASVVAIGLATLLPAPGQRVSSHFCVICGSYGGVDAILNILMFLPLGLGLSMSGWGGSAPFYRCAPFQSDRDSTVRCHCRRDATLGDVLTNSFGGALALRSEERRGAGWYHPHAWHNCARRVWTGSGSRYRPLQAWRSLRLSRSRDTTVRSRPRSRASRPFPVRCATRPLAL